MAETGLIGLSLFAGLVLSAIAALWRSMNEMDVEMAALARTWLIVLILILLGGIVKHDQYDKLLWIVVGMSVALSSRTSTSTMDRNRSLSLTQTRAAKGQEGSWQ